MSDACRGLGDRWRGRDWRAVSVLVVSYEWDPARDGAEAIMGRRLVRALLDAGARVHVLAGSRADEEYGHPAYEVTVAPRRPLSGNKVARAFQMVRSTVPEPAGQWVAGAVRAGERVLSRLPSDTMIYGRACPGASNVVAWHLARRSGLPWVAHFSDEWPLDYVLARGRIWQAPYKWPLFRFWRNRIIRDAGALTFTNPAQGRSILGRSGERHLAKSFVVTHLPFRAGLERPPVQYERFHIVHTGNLYPGRTTAALVQGLRLFLDRTPDAHGLVRLTQAGWANGDMTTWTERCGLQDVVRFVGRVSETDVSALIDDASLLVAFDFARDGSTTMLSKVPDYVTSGRPSLVLTAPTSSLGRLFREDGAGLAARYDSPEEVAACLSDLFQAWRSRRLGAFLPRTTAVESFSAGRVLTELAGAFHLASQARAGARQPMPLLASHGENA